MSLDQANLTVDWSWRFSQPITNFFPARQGAESRSFSLSGLDPAVWDAGILIEQPILPTASLTIDLFSYTDLLFQATGMTAALALAISVPWVDLGTAGPTNVPGLGADNAAAGTVAWSNPTNISASDDARATAVLGAAATSHQLRATQFGFAIPTTATVTGVTVAIERSGTVGGDVKDATVQLLKAGTAAGSNKATATTWPLTDTVATYGGSADLWGTTLSPSDVNNSGFGVLIQAVATAGSTARVDLVTIAVSFTDPRRGLVLSPGASNGLNWMFEDSSDKLWLPTGGGMAWSDYSAGSGTVVDATHRNLTLTSRCAETLTPQIFILGAS